MVVGWLATHVAHNVQSKPLQYVALVGFVAAQAIIFVPLLVIAISLQPGIIESAVGVTLLGTAGLTAVAFDHAQGLLVPARHAHLGRHPGARGIVAACCSASSWARGSRSR